MKKSTTFTLLILTLFLFACEKDETDPANLENNTFTYNDESFEVKDAYLISNTKIENEAYWQITIKTEGVFETGEVVNSFVNSELTFNIIPLDNNSIEGNYSLGDLNGDGIVDEMDAYDAGYCIFAQYSREETEHNFDSGKVNLNKIKGSSEKYQLEFNCSDENDLKISGNIELQIMN